MKHLNMSQDVCEYNYIIISFVLISASNSLFRNNSKMDDQFTSNADAVYLASLTQSKKIMFLER